MYLLKDTFYKQLENESILFQFGHWTLICKEEGGFFSPLGLLDK